MNVAEDQIRVSHKKNGWSCNFYSWKKLDAELYFFVGISVSGPPRYNGQSPWLQTQRSRVLFLALPDFLSRSGSGTGSTQSRKDN
jgi:hypothetical protein